MAPGRLLLVLLLGLVGARQERPTGQGDMARGINGILQGIQPNVLDAKLISVGYVREDLVGELCARATAQLVAEGEGAARQQVDEVQRQVTELVDRRCAGLVVEGDTVCLQLLQQVQERFGAVVGEAMVEGDRQCEAAQRLTVDMVVAGAAEAYRGQRDLGLQLAEAEFLRQVGEESARGERMFQEEVERQREEGEVEFRRRLQDGRRLAEGNLTQAVAEGRAEGERQYAATIREERAKAEIVYQETVDRERAQAEEVFQEQVAACYTYYTIHNTLYRWPRAGGTQRGSSRRRWTRGRARGRRCAPT
jgi:hypothetical protein